MTMTRSMAMFLAFLAIVAEVIFIAAWATDTRHRLPVRLAVLVWPLFLVFLAEAMRMSGRPGALLRLRNESLRLSLAYEREETDVDRLARKLDEVDHSLATVLLCLLPPAAIAFGAYLYLA